MASTTPKLYSYDFNMSKTYLLSILFVAVNVILPQLAHLIPGGGLMLLPIYFCTLIAAYKYGLYVGLITAVLSPIANNLLFGMPPVVVLPAILIKSSLLAIAAGVLSKYFGKVSLIALFIAVATCQILGTAIEWALVHDFDIAVQDFRIGFPGMLLQIFGGFALLKAIEKW